MKETFPDLEVFLYEAQTHQLLEQLETGRLDCAIVAHVPETGSVYRSAYFDEKMLPGGVSEQHPWASKKQNCHEYLKRQEMLMC